MGLTLLFGLVGQHGTKGDISDALDVGNARVELRVDDNAALGVDLDTDRLEVESLGHGSSSNGNKDDIGLDLEVAIVSMDLVAIKIRLTSDFFPSLAPSTCTTT